MEVLILGEGARQGIRGNEHVDPARRLKPQPVSRSPYLSLCSVRKDMRSAIPASVQIYTHPAKVSFEAEPLLFHSIPRFI